jgi:hypothetical protein
VFKDKYASKCEEPDVLKVEVAELKSRPGLLGACTSCLVFHGKIDVMHDYIVSLEAKLKAPVPTSCSTCEVHALKNLETVHYVNHLQDENDELRKMMGWLSGHEPQLKMMMETYKHQDGKALGSEKVGEASGEGGEKIGDILTPPKPTTRIPLLLNPTHYETNSTQTQIHPYSLTPHMISRSLSSSRAHWGMCSSGKKARSRVRRNRLRGQVRRNWLKGK